MMVANITVFNILYTYIQTDYTISTKFMCTSSWYNQLWRMLNRNWLGKFETIVLRTKAFLESLIMFMLKLSFHRQAKWMAIKWVLIPFFCITLYIHDINVQSLDIRSLLKKSHFILYENSRNLQPRQFLINAEHSLG